MLSPAVSSSAKPPSAAAFDPTQLAGYFNHDDDMSATPTPIHWPNWPSGASAVTAALSCPDLSAFQAWESLINLRSTGTGGTTLDPDSIGLFRNGGNTYPRLYAKDGASTALSQDFSSVVLFDGNPHRLIIVVSQWTPTVEIDFYVDGTLAQSGSPAWDLDGMGSSSAMGVVFDSDGDMAGLYLKAAVWHADHTASIADIDGWLQS